MKKQWAIQGGSCYDIKEDLKAMGCTWDAKNKRWITPEIDKLTARFERLKSLAQTFGADFYALDLTGKQKRIRDILNKGAQ